MALTPETVACINAMLVSSGQNDEDAGFAVEELLELFEALMPDPVQRVEPIWSVKLGAWHWLPVP